MNRRRGYRNTPSKSGRENASRVKNYVDIQAKPDEIMDFIEEPSHGVTCFTENKFEEIMEELPLSQRAEKDTPKSNIRSPRQNIHLILPKFIEDLQRFQNLLIDEDNICEDAYIMSLENAVKSRCQKFTNDAVQNEDINDNSDTALSNSHCKDQLKGEQEDDHDKVSFEEEVTGSYCKGREKQEQISVISLLMEAHRNTSKEYRNNSDEIEEICKSNQFNLYDLDDGSPGWDPIEMFERNKRDFGVKSSYSPNMEGYTTPLIRKDTPEYREKEAEAERITQEIVRSSQFRLYEVAENRDEEDLNIEEEKNANESHQIRKDTGKPSTCVFDRNKKESIYHKRCNTQQIHLFDLSHRPNKGQRSKEPKELEKYDFYDKSIPNKSFEFQDKTVAVKSNIANITNDNDKAFRLRSLAEGVKKVDVFCNQSKNKENRKIIDSGAHTMNKMSAELELNDQEADVVLTSNIPRNRKVEPKCNKQTNRRIELDFSNLNDRVQSSTTQQNRKKMSTVASLKKNIPSYRDHYEDNLKPVLRPWQRTYTENKFMGDYRKTTYFNQMQADNSRSYNSPTLINRSSSSLIDSNLSLQSSIPSVSPSINPAKITTLFLYEDVQVTCVYNPSLFYICRGIDLHKRTKMEDMLWQESFDAEEVINPVENELYIAKCPRNNKWYRVAIFIVQEQKKDECLILYVDYGDIDTINKNRIRECPSRLKDIPRFSFKCSLWEIIPARGDVWDTEAKTTFKDLVKDEKLQLFIVTISEDQNEPLYQVELRLPVTTPGIANSVPSSMREVLVFLELAVYINDTQEDKFNQLETATWKKKYFNVEVPYLQDDYPVQLGHIESPGCLYLHLKSFSKDLQKLMKQIQAHYGSAQVQSSKDWNMLVPKLGMPCIAKYSEDQQWYRATIIDIPGKKMVDVFYVDYGNTERLWYKQIKVIHEKFLRLPAQAIRCHLYDMHPTVANEWDQTTHEEQLNSFLLIVEDKELFAKFHKREENDSCSVSITSVCRTSNSIVDIGSYLIDNGFAKSKTTIENAPSSVLAIGNSCSEIYFQEKKKGYRKTAELYDPYNHIKGFPVSDEPKNKREQVLFIDLTDNYIHLRCKNRLKKLQEIQVTLDNEMQQRPVGGRFLPEEGKFCVLKVDHKPFHARVKILKIKEDMAQVHLIDFGGIENVSLSDLAPLPRKLLSEKGQALIVSLNDLIAPGGSAKWPLSTLDFMKSFLSNYKDDLYMVRKDSKFKHPLYDVKVIPVEMGWEIEETGGPITPSLLKPISLNQLLVQEGYALRARSVQNNIKEQEPCIYESIGSLNHSTATLVDNDTIEYSIFHSDSTPDLEERQDPIGDTNPELFMTNQDDCIKQWLPAIPPKTREFNAIPSNVDFEGRVYLTLLEDESTLNEMDENIQKHYRDTRATNADLLYKPGDMVIAKYHLSKLWYRATVLGINKGETTVIFVDYGNEDTVDPGGIRKNLIYKDQPLLTHRCILSGVAPVGKWTLDRLDMLHTKIVDQECRIQLVRPPIQGQDLHIKLQVINSKDHKDISDWLIDAMKVCKRVVINDDDDHLKVSSSKSYNVTQNIDISLAESRDVIVEESSLSSSLLEESVINTDGSDEEADDDYDYLQPFIVNIPLNLPKKDLPKGEYFPVEIISITNEYNMFIRPNVESVRFIESGDFKQKMLAWKKIKQDYNKHFPVENPLMRDTVSFPEVGEIYLALHEFGSKLLYRVQVLEDKKENVEVLFVDQGKRRVIPRKSLRECKPHERSHPVQCIKVILKKEKQYNKRHYHWSDEAQRMAVFNHPLGPYTGQISSIDEDGTPVFDFEKTSFTKLINNRYLEPVKQKFR